MTGEIKRAATLVLVRDSAEGLQTLMLRRHQRMKVGSGHWVFPGGGMDPEDGPLGQEEQASAMQTAVRETWEESGLVISREGLLPLSHWTTPTGYPRRFSTWFFLAEGGEAPVKVDGQEMDDFVWSRPAHLLERHCRGDMAMMPPAVVTLNELASCADVGAAWRFYRDREFPFILPRKAENLDVTCMLYPGDAGYEQCDGLVPGPRSRCYFENSAWRYECRSA